MDVGCCSAFVFLEEFAVAKNATAATRRLVGINQAAEYADVHPITIRRWISAGRVPAYRAGPRLLKIDLNELDAMLRPVPVGGLDAAS
jgi:excisionase family DNA binding protein